MMPVTVGQLPILSALLNSYPWHELDSYQQTTEEDDGDF